jgi:hypothetical protein
MPTSFGEMQERLRTAGLRDLIVLSAGGIDGRTFNELAALRERFLDVAFRGEGTPFNDRSVAAAWARALDSALMIMLETSSQTLEGYVKARIASMDEVIQFGFGSIGWLATTDTNALMRRISFSEAPDPSGDLVRSQHAHLLEVAFGTSVAQPPHSHLRQ